MIKKGIEGLEIGLLNHPVAVQITIFVSPLPKCRKFLYFFNKKCTFIKTKHLFKNDNIQRATPYWYNTVSKEKKYYSCTGSSKKHIQKCLKSTFKTNSI